MANILIIDDEIANIELVRLYLHQGNHHVYTACSGMEGYRLAQQYSIDLIFMDLLMPEHTWTGYEAASRLKSNPANNHIPIVALTAAGNANLAFQAGCDGYLQRPFKRQQLDMILDQYLGAAC